MNAGIKNSPFVLTMKRVEMKGNTDQKVRFQMRSIQMNGNTSKNGALGININCAHH